MKQLKQGAISAMLILLLCMAGCSQEEILQGAGGNKKAVSFILTADSELIEHNGTRAPAATAPKPLKAVWYAIFDSQERVVDVRTQYLSPDFSNLCVEGLVWGKYSIVFLATTSQVEPDAIDKLERLGQSWLINQSKNAPLDADYLFHRLYFEIDDTTLSQDIPVNLQRVSGRVEVLLRPENPQSLRFITNITISYDDTSYIHQEMRGDGLCFGQMVIRDLDVTNSLGFYSLPGISQLSGTIRITSVMTNRKEFTTEHRFEKSAISAGVISTIAIDYTHPEDNKGSFHVAPKDYTTDNSLMMLNDDEPRSTFYNHNERFFYVDQPLQVLINKNKELQIRFYSAIGIKDTKILVRFKKHSREFFELAHYDEILPYQESRMPMPIVSNARVFTSQDGRNILIPAYPNLSNDDCELKIVSHDPYIAKIQTITCHWKITYSPFSATDPPTTNWRHMTPALCREGVALASNMAFMFASAEFYQEMEKKGSDGTYFYKLKDNSGAPIQHQVILNKIKNHSGLNMGAVGGVNGLGGGTTYGLVPSRYYDNYWDATPPENFHKTTAYHELGHCIGYGHSSTMTYGDQWTVLCSRVMYDLGEAGKLPVSSKWVLNTSGNTEIPELPDDEDSDADLAFIAF